MRRLLINWTTIACLAGCVAGLAACSQKSPGDAKASDAVATTDETSAGTGDVAAGPDAASDSATTAGDAATLTPEATLKELIANTAKGACEYAMHCQKGEGYASQAGCEAIQTDVWVRWRAWLAGSIAAKTVIVDLAAAKACSASNAAAACGSKAAAVCDTVVTGTQPDGAKCLDDLECQSRLCVRKSFSCDSGTCQPRGELGTQCVWSKYACKPGLMCAGSTCVAETALEVGQPCSQANVVEPSQCAVGLTCAGSGTLTCRVPAKPGDYCASFFACESSSFCDFDKLGGSVCVAKGKAGDVCPISQQNPQTIEVLAPCQAGLRCVSGGNGQPTCMAAVGQGQACTADAQCLGADLLCLPFEAGKTCQPLPIKGQSCTLVQDPAKYYRCMPPYTCIDNTCVDLPGIGQKCMDRCAGDALCDKATNLCAPPPGLGQVCSVTCAKGFRCVYTAGTGKCVVQDCR